MRKTVCKQAPTITYVGGPWDGLRGSLRGNSTLIFKVGKQVGHYSRTHKICRAVTAYQWMPKQ